MQVDGAEVAVPSASVADFDVFAASSVSAIASQLSGKHRVTVIAAAATAPVLTLQQKLTSSAAPSTIGEVELCSN